MTSSRSGRMRLLVCELSCRRERMVMRARWHGSWRSYLRNMRDSFASSEMNMLRVGRSNARLLVLRQVGSGLERMITVVEVLNL
jgi:hypothetical protein